MNTSLHEISPEEIMAHYDGELAADRAKEVAAHLELCEECNALADSFNATSLSLSSWKFDGPSTDLHPLTSLPPSGRESLDFSAFWQRLHNRRTAVALGIGVSAIAFLFMSIETSKDYSADSKRDVTVTALDLGDYVSKLPAGTKRAGGGGGGGVESKRAPWRLNGQADPSQVSEANGITSRKDRFTRQDSSDATASLLGPASIRVPLASTELPDEGRATMDSPLIARTAELRLVVKKFDEARAAVQSVLLKHQGYVASLNVGDVANTSRELHAFLRVPSQELLATLTELQSLGYVSYESQSGAEVTAEHADLVARLKNSRETEIRLQDILRNRTGKVSDILEVEQEIARVRGEIEQMESELKTLNHRVDLATINLTINEEYKAKVSGSAPAIGIRLHNATVAGFQSAASSALGIILWLIEIMPSLLLWAAVLGFPSLLAVAPHATRFRLSDLKGMNAFVAQPILAVRFS
jgi:uncharacterized protein DUF4349